MHSPAFTAADTTGVSLDWLARHTTGAMLRSGLFGIEREALRVTADVIERSRTTPVLVDFWAPWCGPCRTLKPTLEKLAGEAGDRWALVTVDVMNFEGTAAQFGIRSIPDVKLFSGGRVVAQFTGSMPESAVREWLDKNLPTKAPAQP